MLPSNTAQGLQTSRRGAPRAARTHFLHFITTARTQISTLHVNTALSRAPGFGDWWKLETPFAWHVTM